VNAPPQAPSPPPLALLAQVRCEVGELVSLGALAQGARRYVPLTGGSVRGEIEGRIVEGGIDWQWQRADGVLEIAAHYVIEATDGALIEVQSTGLRHGPADVMAALARGEPVPRDAYYFRTAVRFTTGHPAWQHLNRLLAIAVGEREARAVKLDVWRIG
jgi:hypothetical protein